VTIANEINWLRTLLSQPVCHELIRIIRLIRGSTLFIGLLGTRVTSFALESLNPPVPANSLDQPAQNFAAKKIRIILVILSCVTSKTRSHTVAFQPITVLQPLLDVQEWLQLRAFSARFEFFPSGFSVALMIATWQVLKPSFVC